MTYDTEAAGRSRLSADPDADDFDRFDRILLGSCAGIWLVALGAGVAATVALVDLGQGDAAASGGSDTPWLLYTVIAVSAIVIIGAVPLLLRARREAATADAPPPERLAPRPSLGRAAPPEPGVAPQPLRGAAATAGRPGPAAPVGVMATAPVSPTTAAADHLSVRCAVAIACVIGVAVITTAIGTYLLAVGSTVAGWVFFVLTALVALAMPAVPWYFLKEIRALLDS